MVAPNILFGVYYPMNTYFTKGTTVNIHLYPKYAEYLYNHFEQEAWERGKYYETHASINATYRQHKTLTTATVHTIASPALLQGIVLAAHCKRRMIIKFTHMPTARQEKITVISTANPLGYFPSYFFIQAILHEHM